jgi:uncharacterized protein YdeI (YjbR/CyaY-like superfamily)
MYMNKIIIIGGVAHQTPQDMQKILLEHPTLRAVWEDITPLARNEWICWIESAKQQKTRMRRIHIMEENLLLGKRRPCCWAGCTHR